MIPLKMVLIGLHGKEIKNKKIYFYSFGTSPSPPELVNYLGEDNMYYNIDKFQDYNDPPI